MKKNILIILVLLCGSMLLSWQNAGRHDYEKQVLATEKAFEKMAADKGIAQAFYFFADADAVIKRQNDSLIKGKEAIRHFYARQNLTNASVHWTPDFVEVSKSGDLAYTYGQYIWKTTNEKGENKTFTGIFHTVWKRQKDGSWKYVWD